MKKLYNIIIFVFVLFYYGCDKPAPTELIPTEIVDPLEIELLADNPDDELYNSGFDTTGIPVHPTDFENLVWVAGVKSDHRMDHIMSSQAQAIFFDRSKPLTTSNGRVIGYMTLTPGIVRFDNFLTAKIPYRIQYRDKGGLVDTSLGLRYVISNRGQHGGGQHNQNFVFEYNSSINFNYRHNSGSSYSFDIPTPPEMNGEVSFTGSRRNQDLIVNLDWNSNTSGNFEIIIGIENKRQGFLLPVYRIKTRDDGMLSIPANILREIPPEDFERIVFTFIRKFEFEKTAGDSNIHVISESIHSISVEIP